MAMYIQKVQLMFKIIGLFSIINQCIAQKNKGQNGKYYKQVKINNS